MLEKYLDTYDSRQVKGGLTQSGREKGIKRLMSIYLMKRMESSVHSFKLTLDRINRLITDTIQEIENFETHSNSKLLFAEDYSNTDFDEDDQADEFFIIGHKVQIDLVDMDYKTWKREFKENKDNLDLLLSMVFDIIPKYDKKLNFF